MEYLPYYQRDLASLQVKRHHQLPDKRLAEIAAPTHWLAKARTGFEGRDQVVDDVFLRLPNRADENLNHSFQLVNLFYAIPQQLQKYIFPKDELCT